MKAKILKTLALLLTFAMCIGMFAGCAKEIPDPTTEPAAPTETDAAAATTPATEAVVESNLTVYPLESEKVFQIATAQENMNDRYWSKLWNEVTGVETDFVFWDAEQTKLALAGKTLPDAFFATNFIDKATAYEYGSAGHFVNFMDYLDYMPNFKAAMEAYPSTLAFATNEDGTMYALPRLGTTATVHGVVYVRMDMLNEIGWEETPKTTDEFLQCINELQAHFGAEDADFLAFDGYKAGYLNWVDGNALLGYFFPTFGDLMKTTITVTPDGKEIVLGAATEQYKYMLEFLNEVYNSGAFSKDVYTKDGTSSQTMALENKVAISPYMSFLKPDNFASGDINELGVLEPLTSEYRTTQHYNARSSYTWQSAMINANLPEEDIITLVRWFDSFYSTEETPMTEDGTVWGISIWLGKLGTDWVKDEETKTYEILPHEGFDTSSNWLNSQSAGSSAQYLGSFMYIENSGTGLMRKGLGTINNLMPYAEEPAFDTSMLTLNQDESDTYSDYWTDIEKYVGEETAKFITGERDIAEFDAFVQELYAMGLQDVLDVYQAAYQRFLDRQ